MKWVGIIITVFFACHNTLAQIQPSSLEGIVQTSAARIASAEVQFDYIGRGSAGKLSSIHVVSDAHGSFSLAHIAPGHYRIQVRVPGVAIPIVATFQLHSATRQILLNVRDSALSVQELQTAASTNSAQEQVIKSAEVSDLPLEQRDSSSLLLLSAGTTTAAATGSNFTQQYSIHGQPGTEAVFALDGGDTTDPELGGGTITDFNVDAIQRIDTFSGVMPASLGEGAAGYTDVITKSGTDQVHGVYFEFLRNSALDARNYFDHPTPAAPGRIPPFIRNEFGLTDGGPVVLPRLYNGRGRTYYFVEYQGLRQIQGTTQVLSVPTPTERQGLDTTAYPGDTLVVPVDSNIAAILNRYPEPNFPSGPFGPRTYASDSKVDTSNDQFSIRLDHRLSSISRLMGRYTLENVDGPITNPNQTAIDPSFARLFTELYRSAVINYARVPSAHLSMETTASLIRSTPLYSSENAVQPGITFGDNLFEAFNSEAGGYQRTWGNVLLLRQTATFVHRNHVLEAGIEARFNRDISGFSNSTNGSRSFGGGPVYSDVIINSTSGTHDIHPGDLLPDTLSAFLSATPYTFLQSGGGNGFGQGVHTGEGAVHRESYNGYFLDNWQARPHLTVNYGIRYEVSSRIHEPHDLTSGALFLDANGQRTNYTTPGAQEEWLVNPQPPYSVNWKGWGPRLGLTWQVRSSAKTSTTIKAGAGITTLVSYPFANTNITNDFPFAVIVSATAQPSAPIPFHAGVLPFLTPVIYTLGGAPLYQNGTTKVTPNTPVDLNRYEKDLAAMLPGDQVQPLVLQGQAANFRNRYLSTWSFGIDQQFGSFSASADYIGISSVGLPIMTYPNGYVGADPQFAPHSEFGPTGQFIGGFGPENFFISGAHSSYNGGEFILSKSPTRWGIGLNATYTYSKELDDCVGAGISNTEPVTFSLAQTPFDVSAEKSRSSSELGQTLAYTISLQPALNQWFHFSHAQRLLTNWQANAIGQWNDGLPFTVYSGVEQAGYGNGGGYRPDQAGKPSLSTHHAVRDDYFGQGANNASFFSIPINVPGGTGPFHGRAGTLGRNTFTGPHFSTLDLALSKSTPIAKTFNLEARAEFYNLFNTVNFGLPNNVLNGSGFGIINSTNNGGVINNSRQMQLSLKLVY
jgi:hypothetical protein